MANPHYYRATVTWTGAKHGPAINYEGYSREYHVEFEGKPSISGSADPSYRGDASLPNPEDLLVASISACHLLTFLALAVRSRMDVISYTDSAQGIMQMFDGKMRVTDVILTPIVVLRHGADIEQAMALHDKAHDECFISNSVTCDIKVAPEIRLTEVVS